MPLGAKAKMKRQKKEQHLFDFTIQYVPPSLSLSLIIFSTWNYCGLRLPTASANKTSAYSLTLYHLPHVGPLLPNLGFDSLLLYLPGLPNLWFIISNFNLPYPQIACMWSSLSKIQKPKVHLEYIYFWFFPQD